MKSCGILMHITSLPGRYGVGTMGKEAFRFVDFLKKSGQSCWQVLPIGPTGYGDSPYQSYSAFAGNPLLIDLEELISDGLIAEDDKDLILLDKRDFSSYEELMSFKTVVLNKAFLKYTDGNTDDFDSFCAENSFWLEDYALYMSLKSLNKQNGWLGWDNSIRRRDPETMAYYKRLLSQQMDFQKFMQFVFFRQWDKLHKYANKKGVKLFGDMAIYVSMDSSDIWAEPSLFMLDEDLRPTDVAGCPPDDFSATGQLWGNPLYNWDAMEKDGYKWWIKRIGYSAKLFDILRIDHFRGFESFYAIPAGSVTAEKGEWLKGPGMKLFNAVKKELGEIDLVAENLGFLTDEVHEMLADSGYPGMNVLEFAFWKKNESGYMPHNYIANSVSYIGTHDNDTALGWFESLDKKTKKFVCRYLDIREGDSPVRSMIRALYASVSDLVIIQMQDLLELGSEARMNTPSTIGNNWHWRMSEHDINKALAKKVRYLAKTYFRVHKKSELFAAVSADTDDADTSAYEENENIPDEVKSEEPELIITEDICAEDIPADEAENIPNDDAEEKNEDERFENELKTVLAAHARAAEDAGKIISIVPEDDIMDMMENDSDDENKS